MSQSKALTPAGQICVALDKMEGSLNETLAGTGVSVKRFLATAKTAVQTHSDQKSLEAADRNSLYLAIKKAAGDGLMPDGREAALVVYNTKQKDGTWLKQVQYQPMVQGLVKLARNSGEIESINAEVVYQNDEFELYYDFDGVRFKHVPNWKQDRGEPILVWACIKLKSGERIAKGYTKEKIQTIASHSKNPGNYDCTGKLKDKFGNILGTDWEEWWRKAAIRNILKYAPRTTSLDMAMQEADNEFDYGEETPVNSTPQNPVSDKPKTESRAASAIKAKTVESEPEHNIVDVEAVITHPEDVQTYDVGDEEEIPV